MHALGYLNDILILLFASVLIVLFFKRLSMSPAIGYLVAGALIGPYGFEILQENETTKSIAELGIVFLLFAIGLELNLSKLIRIRKYVLGFGGLQVAITTLAIEAICTYGFGLSSDISLVIGAALALSSTAIVLQIISDGGEETTRVGRLAVSILILQDLAVIPILVLLPLLANPDVGMFQALGKAILNASIALAIILVIGRYFLRPIYHHIDQIKSDALFISLTLIIIFGAAQLSSFFGLSSAFGAFTAGLMVAETEFRHRVEQEIISIKTLLMSLFFMTIGMSFQVDFLVTNFHKILLISILLITVKAFIVIFLCKIFRFPLAPSIHAGLLLAQGGEFAFIVFIMAVDHGLINQEMTQLLATVVTATMAITPLLAKFGKKIKGQLYVTNVIKDNKIKREIGDISDHVIVIGFGRIGHIVSHILKKKGANYLILDNNHRIVRIEKANGFNIYYGDAMNIEILRHISIDKSEAVIVVMEDEIACLKVCRFISDNFPQANIITKTEVMNNVSRMKRAGANYVVAKNFETAMQVSKVALKMLNFTKKDIEKTVKTIRKNDEVLIKEVLKDKDNKENIENIDLNEDSDIIEDIIEINDIKKK